MVRGATQTEPGRTRTVRTGRCGRRVADSAAPSLWSSFRARRGNPLSGAAAEVRDAQPVAEDVHVSVATPPPARSPAAAGRSRPGCGRHRHCRPARPGTSICRFARCPPGSSPRRGYRRRAQLSSAMSCTVCGAWRSGEASTFQRPASISAISLPDRDHGIAEAVELRLQFGFGRLDHQRARHREAHGRGVEAVVDQPLGDVIDGDAGLCLQRRGDR